MLTKNKQKLLKSLQLKKYRKEEQSFFVEGEKSVLELIKSDFEIIEVFATKTFIDKHKSRLEDAKLKYSENPDKILQQAGSYKSNNTVIALVKQRPDNIYQRNDKSYTLVLDDVRDPGNLGTIIRIADWYGIKNIICSTESADIYNPKVIQASMGSFSRIRVHYCNLEEFLKEQKENNESIYGAFLDGENIHKTSFDKNGFIVMGNESNGIRKCLEPYISKKISIPNYGNAESLNVGVATAVICDNLIKSIKY